MEVVSLPPTGHHTSSDEHAVCLDRLNGRVLDQLRRLAACDGQRDLADPARNTMPPTGTSVHQHALLERNATLAGSNRPMGAECSDLEQGAPPTGESCLCAARTRRDEEAARGGTGQRQWWHRLRTDLEGDVHRGRKQEESVHLHCAHVRATMDWYKRN